MNDPSRWNHYVLEHGTGLQKFWQHHLSGKPRRLLFILAKGFDPRMCLGLEQILALQKQGTCDVALIEFSESPTSPSWADHSIVDAKMAKLTKLMDQCGQIRRMPLKMRSADA